MWSGCLTRGGHDPLQSFAIVFDSENETRQSAHRLVKKHGVTGEIEIRPLAGGKWLLQVSSEKDLRDTTLEKLAGQRVEAGSLAELEEAGT